MDIRERAWPTLASRYLSSVPWTASLPRRRASWPISCGWRCPVTTARACWTGCPTWGGWYAKPVCAYLLEAELAQWQHFKWSLDATAHVDQRCLELVLERMAQNWPEGEEHYAKLAINSLVGLFARNLGLFHDFQSSGGRRGVQLALDLHGCGRGDALGPRLRDGAALEQQLSPGS